MDTAQLLFRARKGKTHPEFLGKVQSYLAALLKNGQIITITIDRDPARRPLSGILSLQLEGSGQIWYRNVYLKVLP